jgi:hypothetical protein
MIVGIDCSLDIVQWWLSGERTERRVAEIERNVSSLVSEKLALQTSRTGLPTDYRLNDQRGKEILSMQGILSLPNSLWPKAIAPVGDQNTYVQ